MAEQTVELQPGESRAIAFEAIPHEAKTYQVSVDGLAGSFKATAPPEPEFVVSNLRVEPATGTLLEAVYIYFDVTNIGGPGRSKVRFTVERPSYTGSTNVYFTLDAGEITTYTKRYVLVEVGNYIATVDSLSATFACTAPTPPPPPPPPTFDPWSYDTNGDGVIDTQEMLKAVNDYYAGIITKAQVDQVVALWEQG